MGSTPTSGTSVATGYAVGAIRASRLKAEIVLEYGSPDSVTVVLGTFTSTTGGSRGNFNFSIRGTVIHGDAVDDGGTVVPLDGTYTAPDGTIGIAHPSGGAPLATGTFNYQGTASGTYDYRNGNSGNWIGAHFWRLP